MTELDTKYNYVFFISDPFVAQMYRELSDHKDMKICQNGLIREHTLLNKIHKLHWSYKLNRKINLPFKKIWFSKMTSSSLNGKPTCYVFFGGQYCISDYGLVDYIRRQNPENKIVAYFLDLIRHKHINDFSALKNKCDLVVSYDQQEAQAYDIALFKKGVYSKMVDVTHPTEFEYDLYFAGYAKDRLDRLLSLYDCLSAQGVRCCFKLAGLSPETKLNGEGLYKLDKPMAYREIVNDLQKTRCVLELSQANATGLTMRTCEAICYQRKLLTDRVLDAQSNTSQFSSFSEPENVDVAFLKSALQYDLFEKNTDLSPFAFVEFLERQFEVEQ